MITRDSVLGRRSRREALLLAGWFGEEVALSFRIFVYCKFACSDYSKDLGELKDTRAMKFQRWTPYPPQESEGREARFSRAFSQLSILSFSWFVSNRGIESLDRVFCEAFPNYPPFESPNFLMHAARLEIWLSKPTLTNAMREANTSWPSISCSFEDVQSNND